MCIDNTQVVSSRFLFWAMSTIVGNEDLDEEDIPQLYFPGMDSNDPAEVKERVIRPFVVPWVRSLDETAQRMTQDSFRYCLNVQMPDIYGVEFFQSMFNSIAPNFEGPKPIRLFFVWIWEELYGPEDYHTHDLSQYVVDDVTPYETLIREAQK